jgi:glycosyltransferase involved in cell wall biosynthesis
VTLIGANDYARNNSCRSIPELVGRTLLKKPLILYVAPCWPHGKSFGSQTRVLHVGRALQQIGDVRLAIIDFAEDDQTVMCKSADEFAIECSGRLRRLNPPSWASRIMRDFNPAVANPHDWRVDENVRDQIDRNLQKFDLIWLSNLRMANAFERWRWPRSVMDIDDVPSSYQKSVWQNGAGFRERVRAGLEMLVWRQREQRLGQRFNVLAVCSEADRQYLGAKTSVHVIPNGFARPTVEPQSNRRSAERIGFIGPFSYPPNSQGVRWFVESCWPKIAQQIPGARLRLVGKDTAGAFPGMDDVDGLGWISDPSDEIATWSAMIVPTRVGAGTRVKIAEAFSRKCPVVSTRLGAFGYDVKNGRELCLADSALEFARACVRLMRDPEEGSAMANRAWQRFLDEWTWEAITPRIWAAAEDCLRQSRN